MVCMNHYKLSMIDQILNDNTNIFNPIICSHEELNINGIINS